MKIKQKIVFSNLISIIIVSIITIIGIVTFSNIHKALIEIDKEAVPLVMVIEELRFAGLRIVASTSEYALISGESKKSWTTVESNSEEYEQVLVGSAVQNFNNEINRYVTLAFKHLPGKRVQTNNIQMLGKELIGISAEIINAKKEGIYGNEILEIKEEFEKVEIAFLKATSDVRLHAERLLGLTNDNIQSKISKAINTLILSGLCALAILLMAGLFLSRSLSTSSEINGNGSESIFEVNLNTSIDMGTKNEIDQSTSSDKINEDVNNNASPQI